MKTAQEWKRYFLTLIGKDVTLMYCAVTEKEIAKIQSDALRHAADTVYGNGLLHGDGSVQKAIKAIIEEADKLETK